MIDQAFYPLDQREYLQGATSALEGFLYKSAEPELLRLRAISQPEWDGSTLEKSGKPITE